MQPKMVTKDRKFFDRTIPLTAGGIGSFITSEVIGGKAGAGRGRGEPSDSVVVSSESEELKLSTCSDVTMAWGPEVACRRIYGEKRDTCHSPRPDKPRLDKPPAVDRERGILTYRAQSFTSISILNCSLISLSLFLGALSLGICPRIAWCVPAIKSCEVIGRSLLIKLRSCSSVRLLFKERIYGEVLASLFPKEARKTGIHSISIDRAFQEPVHFFFGV